MAKFKITFRHTEVREFEAVIEAETEEEAIELLEEDAYEYVEDQEGNLIESKDFEILETEEIEE